MTFKDVEGDWPNLVSSFTSLCAAFLILIGLAWILLVTQSRGRVYIPGDPVLTAIYPYLGGIVILAIGGVMIVATRIIDRRNKFT
ncbi:MAG: hypothetical protein RTU30_01610 [Candidatus Thorarchaeota archaeon]